MRRLEEYRTVVGSDVLEELQLLANPLSGKRVVNINSTAVGGGVAEILNGMIPLLKELGVDARWDVLKGGEAFYVVTKKFHNALHGDPVRFEPADFRVYEETVEGNAALMALDSDVVYVHDPQPASLVQKRAAWKNRWIWRCHIDLTRREQVLWDYLRPVIESYDAAVFSSPAFAQNLPIPQVLIAPSIDPLSDKNRPLEDKEVKAVAERLGVPLDKPLITQVSRFDRLKDPVGVIEAFQMARKEVPARLLIVGGAADDDPEGMEVLAEVQEKAKGDADILVLNLPPTSHLEINALQRASTVVVQKSLREGFGLTVSEALWKNIPVIGGAVGGIPQQVLHEHTGLLVTSVPEAAKAMARLLKEPEWAKNLGRNGHQHVRQNFLLTRHLRDYLLLFHSVLNPGEHIVRL
ncbi:MAG TPA: glycosyltransferase [Elusimicrobiota bacterium]|nr:glycosyltransferase [Elusimicrobiota bacterium]HMU95457.1 glycosyltransferase [Elusimicrobiota bacterium]HMX42452.1 glycosyltransferase [Elusimicrobiota bacterium]HND63913.1 glycosyltransferase [Elusimicrobiota bacterium]